MKPMRIERNIAFIIPFISIKWREFSVSHFRIRFLQNRLVYEVNCLTKSTNHIEINIKILRNIYKVRDPTAPKTK